jgi:hypothetical protein
VNWLLVVAGFVGSVLSGGGAAAAINALARRGTVKVEAADMLTDTALEIVTAVKAEASDARREVAALRQEVHALTTQLHRIRLAIMTPGATLASLRAMVGEGDATNGTR